MIHAASFLVLAVTAQARDVDWLVAPDFDTPVSVTTSDDGTEVTLGNGLIERTWRIGPETIACIAFDDLVADRSLLRAVRPEARITVDGETRDIGGLVGQPNHAYLKDAWLDDMQPAPGAFRFIGLSVTMIDPPMDWKRVRHHAPDAVWPPAGRGLVLNFAPRSDDAAMAGLLVSVHYEMYQGVPLMAKWISVRNGGDRSVTLDRFTSEVLALVEHRSELREQDGVVVPDSYLHVETDLAFAAGNGNQCANTVHRIADPEFATQVDYRRRNPCLLEVRPEIGPGVRLEPGQRFKSFRTYELVHDSTDRERRGLALRRMYRTLAPWVTENPLMMHVRFADDETVRAAIDQCAEVGFEMVILTFGSGFNIEDDSDANLARMRGLALYAADRGVEIGGYSLLASRSIGPDDDIVMPAGERPTFGNSPCLESAWGQAYFATLERFYDATGFMLLEHDGNYPGDACDSETHPGHAGRADSRWRQWQRIAGFYRWCRARGIYLNVPDWYHLAGANKSAMGYRETNWSLPRAEQVIHTRQNIHDGTWEKTPSMGWMFVPLTEYHGGGDAATIEPLHEHLDHYERMLASNLALGVQACYRGPRLFDTPATADMVRRHVAWFKQYRAILESDLVHGRRADGRDLDWMLHVNPRLADKGMLVMFNPLAEARSRSLRVNLYYTGLTDTARVSHEGDAAVEHTIGRDHSIRLNVTVPARGWTWFVVR